MSLSPLSPPDILGCRSYTHFLDGKMGPQSLESMPMLLNDISELKTCILRLQVLDNLAPCSAFHSQPPDLPSHL